MVNATKNQNPANLPNGVSRLVKRAGADTTLKNAVRDGAEWAWVPHGDTCPFCITLASNGWQKASSKVLKGGHANHIHANCDCEFAIRFDHKTTVAGYDPEKYLKQYRDAGGDINKMRRIDYAARKDAINAQKRAAYALRQKNRGKKVSITDIAIQKVPLVAPNGADHQTAFFIQETHKELLRFAQTQNNSNEVACLLDLTTGEKLDFVKGDQVSVDVEADAASYHWLQSKSPKSLMLCHNHPGQSYFSMNDISVFMYYPQIKSLSIVTNQGKVWHITKLDRFDFDETRRAMENAIIKSKGNGDKAVDLFLKECYNYGVERG